MITLKDRVKETAVVSGAGLARFTGRVNTAFRAFLDVMSEGDQTLVCIESVSQFEVVQAIIAVDSTGAYIERGPSSGNTVLSSSNDDDWVDFGAGDKYVFCDLHAGFLLLGQNFSHGETPDGVVNGGETGTSGNAVFTLDYAPSPPASLLLAKDDIGAGLVMYAGTHFNLSGNTITFTLGNIPRTGAKLRAWYQHQGV